MTPAIRLLQQLKMPHQVHEYQHDSHANSYGLEAAEKLNLNPSEVFKTLVVETHKQQLAVAVVPVCGKLNLKAMAKALKVKKITMADAKKVERITGYVLGGVSPLGQKRKLPTVIHASAQSLKYMYISGGKRGLDISLAPNDLQRALSAQFAAIGQLN